MRLDVDELHIYIGIVVLALGAGLAAGIGVGLIVYGACMVGLGIFRSLAPEAPAAPPVRPSDAVMATLIQESAEQEE